MDSSSKTVGETEMTLFNFSHEIPAKINWRCIHDKIYIERSSRVSKDDAGAGNNFGHEKTIRTYKFLNDHEVIFLWIILLFNVPPKRKGEKALWNNRSHEKVLYRDIWSKAPDI